MEKFISARQDISPELGTQLNEEAESQIEEADLKDPLSSGEIETNSNETASPQEEVPVRPLLEKLKRLSAQKILLPKWMGKLWRLPDGKKPLHRRYLFWLSLTCGGGAIAFYYGLRSIDRTLPNTADVFSFVREGTLTIKAANGDILQQTGPATREKLELAKIPPQLVKAFIAIEDRRFYQHGGVDYFSIFRAVVANVVAKDLREGASTITQQLARIVFLDQERSIWRKLREARLAQKIEQKMGKNQILERYLNLVYLGSGAYGVADATLGLF